MLHTSTDASAIVAVLDAALERDPVRNTIFGSIRAALAGADGDGWCAWSGHAVAVRGRRTTPVAFTEGWSELGPLAEALAELPDLRGLGGPVETVSALVTLLHRTPTSRMDERLFRLDDLITPEPVAGAARVATTNDTDLLTDWYSAFIVEAFGALPPAYEPRRDVVRGIAAGGPHLWETDGAPCAMAVRHPAVSGVARIGPVYTPAGLRGRGYGTAITAALSGQLLAEGVTPVLYTDLANPTSNAIYQRLGYRPVTDRAAVTF